MGNDLLVKLMLVVLFAYVVLAYFFVKKKSRIIIEKGDLENAIDINDVIAMPRELIINIVEDKEIDYAVYSDITLKISDLLSGNYKIPEKFFKEKKDVITIKKEGEKEQVDVEIIAEERIENVNMAMFENLDEIEEEE